MDEKEYIWKSSNTSKTICWLLQSEIEDISIGLDLDLDNYLRTQSLYFTYGVTP